MALRSFGDFVKRQRKVRDLTQQALADRLGCAVVTLRKIEAGMRRPSQQISQRLADVLAIPAGERAAFLQHARSDSASLVPTNSQDSQAVSMALAPAVSLQSRPALIGRSRELADVTCMLRHPTIRLITLTGPGGVGKTRLAQEAAATLQHIFPDGICFVSLASLHDPALVVSTVARLWGVTETNYDQCIAQLTAAMRGKQLLLVVDNFEHVLTAALFISDLLAATTTLKILVTSRTTLHLSTEYVFDVPALTVPESGLWEGGAELSASTAVALFVQQAQMREPAFTLNSMNAAAIGAICVQLDGLPLALVLAAAHCRFLSPQYVLQQLSSPLAFLTNGAHDLPQRQQTLRTTIAWSYDLLSTEEQHFFRSSAVFVTGWTLEAAEVVVGQPDHESQSAKVDIEANDVRVSVVAIVESLVNQSLLERCSDLDQEPRFAMLETIREYALEQLSTSEATARLVQKHALYYQSLVERAASALRGTDQLVWFAQLDAALPNVRGALQWSIDHNDGVTALRIAIALWRYWSIRGMIVEGSRWIERALASEQDLPPHLYGKALAVLSSLSMAQGNLVQAKSLALKSCSVLAPLDDFEELGTAFGLLGLIALSENDYAQAKPLLEESLRFARASGDSPGIAWGLNNLSGIYVFSGDITQAQQASAEALDVYRSLNDLDGVLVMLQNRGWFAALQNDYDQARAFYRASICLSQDLQESGEGFCELLEKIAATFAAQFEYQESALLLGVAAAQRISIGCPVKSYNQAEYDHTLATTQIALPETQFVAAWNTGQAMPLQQVTAYILDTLLPEAVQAI